MATAAIARRARACRWVALGGSMLASAVTLTIATQVIASGRAIDGVLLRHAASGIVLGYSITPLSAWFLMVEELIAIPVAFYSVGYFAHAVSASRTPVVGTALNLLLGALEIVFAADAVIVFLFAWELMSLSTAVLVATEHQERASRRAAYLYLVMSHVGTGCLVAGFLVLAATSGSPPFSTLLAGHVLPGPPRDGVVVLLLLRV